MTEPGTWRSLRSVMLVTLHVAVISALIRYLDASRGQEASLIVWIPVTIAIVTLVSWPISRIFFSEYLSNQIDPDRACPRCRRDELRPLVRPGQGIFQPVTSFKCAGCWTTVRIVDGTKVIEAPSSQPRPVNRAGIQFLDEPEVEEEIRFLDETPKSSS